MIKAKIKVHSGEYCTDLELGCYVSFNNNTNYQYIPAKANNFLLMLDGLVNFVYEDGSSYNAVPLHSTSEWTSYQDPWKYNTVLAGKTHANSRLLQIEFIDTNTSDYRFQAKKIENETLAVNTTSNSILISYGSNLTVNGETSAEVLSEHSTANVNSFSFTAVEPATIIHIEKL